jgi:hypothetical protein
MVAAVRALARIGVLGGSVLLTGCYTLQPTRGVVPPAGTSMGFDITDAGRVALGGVMGPEISQIEGRLVERDSNDYVIAVSGVHFLRGGEQTWHGEAVRIRADYVSSLYVRRFSASRSVALGAAGASAVAAIAVRSLIGSATDQGGRSPGDTAQTQRSPRRP